jgi:hypothetical protein
VCSLDASQLPCGEEPTSLKGFALATAGACYNAALVPTQFKATQLVVAIAVWANAISARGAHPNLSPYFLIMHQNNVMLLLDNNALFLLGNVSL